MGCTDSVTSLILVRKNKKGGVQKISEPFRFCSIYNLESTSEFNETNADDGKKFVIDTSILQMKAEGSVVHHKS